MLPTQFERSLNLNHLYKYNRIYKKFNFFQAKVNLSETNFCKQNKIKNLGRLVLNHSTNIEGLIPLLQKLALNIDIKTVTPGVISRARGRTSKLIIRLSVKTINGYKAIARKGKTAQEVFISTDLTKDELKDIINICNTQQINKRELMLNQELNETSI